jgi:HEAT repeat protein
VEPDKPATDLGGAERRASLAVAGHNGDLGAVRAGLVDVDARVRAAAVRALIRLGAATTGDIAAAIADRSAIVRRTVCELAAEAPGGVAGEFASLLSDPEGDVVEAAAFAVGELGDDGAIGMLCEIATTHADALCRESAVAALGAIGDPRGKAAVLAALDDSNYVRRRAVVALAAFSGPDVAEALERRLHDRDWQVRQAAEDIIGVNRQIGP